MSGDARPALVLARHFSFAEAVRMEQQDALPRTAFYETPALTGSRPGALLRQESFVGYAVPPGTTSIRILYHSLSAAGKDVATSAVVLVPPGRMSTSTRSRRAGT